MPMRVVECVVTRTNQGSASPEKLEPSAEINSALVSTTSERFRIMTLPRPGV